MVNSSVFASGPLFMTAGVSAACGEDPVFAQFLHYSLKRHLNGDWGELSLEDRESNAKALTHGGRIFSVYKPLFTIGKYSDKVWVITEADRSSTTALFPHEY